MPVHPIYKKIGELIQTRRKALKIKQEALASTLRISRGSLANIETGKQSILVHQIYNFASALQLTVPDLLPPAGEKAAASERTELPLPNDLKSTQKEQVARLFLQGDQ